MSSTAGDPAGTVHQRTALDSSSVAIAAIGDGAQEGGVECRMGLTHVSVKVGNPANDRRTEEVRCLVDSGAIYSLVPRTVLRRLGIEPHSTREFVLANGDVIRRRLATATFECEGQRGDSMVIVGEPGDDPLLGATTLEGFGLVLDPFRRELRPTQLPLKRAS
jgi:clan AA aspartic protease